MKKTYSTEISLWIKALAMFLMMIHHMWAYRSIGFFPKEYANIAPILIKIGELGKVCVGMFMLTAGYGNYCSLTKKSIGYHGDAKFILKRFIATYRPFLIVFILLVPLLCLLEFIKTTPIEVVKNLMLASNSINGTWWFLQTYLISVITMPFLFKISGRAVLLWIVLGASICFTLFSENIKVSSSHYFLHYYVYYVVGALFAKYDVVNRLCKKNITIQMLSMILGFSLHLVGLKIGNGLVDFLIEGFSQAIFINLMV